MSTLNNLPLAELRARYGLRSFVETGTLDGDGILYAIEAGFDCLYSCDIVGVHVQQARARFAGYKNIKIFHRDSLTFIRQLPLDIGPSLWWLDAHQPAFYDGAIAETPENKFPVLHELELIKQRPGYEHDVILIDDIIVIQGSPRWHDGEVCEYFQVRDVTYEQLTAAMSGTHEAEYLPKMEGVLLFTPKPSLTERGDSWRN